MNRDTNPLKPVMRQRKDLLTELKAEKDARLSGGIYHKIQIELTYNSNHIEGSRLTREQTRFIYETRTISTGSDTARLDDIVETVNHFRCVDRCIDEAPKPLSGKFIKSLHAILKAGTGDGDKDWFAVGDYKRFPNEIGGIATTAPEDVPAEMKKLLAAYRAKKTKKLDDLLDFHVRFERIHPFQDGNGRVGRLILFKECLKHDIVPFVITEELKLFYYRGLAEWRSTPGFLRDTCLTAQDRFKKTLDDFRIPYKNTID